MYTRILVPLDGSELAEQVIPITRTLAWVYKAKIVLLCIAEYPYEIYSLYDEYSALDPQLMETMRNKENAICRVNTVYLKQIASNLEKGGLSVITEVCDGPVVQTILDSIDRFGIDLITMSACGSGGGTSWVLGSIANRVLCEARVPVILVRPQKDRLGVEFPTMRNSSYQNNPKDNNELRFWTGTFSPAGTIFRN